MDWNSGPSGICAHFEPGAMDALLSRLFTEESGQDLIEYALLTTVIGLAIIAVFDVLRNSIAVVYGSWNDGANSIWESPDPGAGAS